MGAWSLKVEVRLYHGLWCLPSQETTDFNTQPFSSVPVAVSGRAIPPSMYGVLVVIGRMELQMALLLGVRRTVKPPLLSPSSFSNICLRKQSGPGDRSESQLRELRAEPFGAHKGSGGPGFSWQVSAAPQASQCLMRCNSWVYSPYTSSWKQLASLNTREPWMESTPTLDSVLR